MLKWSSRFDQLENINLPQWNLPYLSSDDDRLIDNDVIGHGRAVLALEPAETGRGRGDWGGVVLGRRREPLAAVLGAATALAAGVQAPLVVELDAQGQLEEMISWGGES